MGAMNVIEKINFHLLSKRSDRNDLSSNLTTFHGLDMPLFASICQMTRLVSCF